MIAALILVLLALFLGCQSAETQDFDLQAAIDACPVGGTVTIPAGTYTLTRQVDLKSGVTIQGAPGRTILTMPAQSTATNLLYGNEVSGVAIRDLTLSCPAATGQVLALHFSRYANVTIERVKVTGCQYALKADTQGSNLVVRDFSARACGQIYISNLTGGLFKHLDLQMVTQKLTAVAFHCLYVAANNHSLRFNNVRAVGGSGFAVQCWMDSGSPSTDIVFDGLTVTHDWALVIGSGFDGVTIYDLNASVTDNSEGVVNLESPRNVIVDGFTASGGHAFLTTYAGADPENVTIRDGTYAGTILVQPNATISGLVIDNAGLSNATNPTPPSSG